MAIPVLGHSRPRAQRTSTSTARITVRAATSDDIPILQTMLHDQADYFEQQDLTRTITFAAVFGTPLGLREDRQEHVHSEQWKELRSTRADRKPETLAKRAIR